MRMCVSLFSFENKLEIKGEDMKCLIMSAAIIGSVFIFSSCATENNNNNSKNNNVAASSNPQESPFARPNDAIFNDTGFNYWPQTFRYPYYPGTEAGQ